MATTEKGTKENPYTMEEYEALLDAGTWQGGFVRDDAGSVVYTMKEVTVNGYSGYSGYSGYGSSGSGFGSLGAGWWGSDPMNGGNTDGDNTDEGGHHSGGHNTGGGGTNTSGGGGGHNNNNGSTPKSRALDIIKRFENRVTSVVYPNISKTKFIQDLRKQIYTPALVKQGENGTCGIAAICKYLLECMPDKYAEAAISLYETGKYDKWGLKVCEASKTGTDAQAKELKTTALDCIVQGAFRNTYNETTNYNPFTDKSGWSSITWPTEINSFFENQLHKNCDSNTYLFPTDSFDRLSKIDYSRKYVIALISVINGSDDFGTGYPDHYVQITNVTEDNKIKYWQLGDTNPYQSNTTKVWGLYIIDR